MVHIALIVRLCTTFDVHVQQVVPYADNVQSCTVWFLQHLFVRCKADLSGV